MKKKSIKFLLASFGILLLMSFVLQQKSEWVAPKEADALVNPFKDNVDATKEGKKQFNQLCAICHGNKGKGDGIAGAALNPKPANFTTDKFQSQTDGAIFWKMTNGRTPMAAYKDILPEDQRWKLVNYLRTLSK